jgi:hypothetical protein
VLRINGDSLCYIAKDKITSKFIRIALNNHNGNIMSIVTNERFVYAVSKLTSTERAEVYAFAVGICSAVVFHVPHDTQLIIETPLDDVKYETNELFRNNKGIKTRITVFIGKYSKSMKIKHFKKFLLKWYPEHSYLKDVQHDVYDNDQIEINFKPIFKGYKQFGDSYKVIPNKCINNQKPRHMYDTCVPCECQRYVSDIMYTYNENHVGMLKSRFRSIGDPIRGDLVINPLSDICYTPSVNPDFDLNKGSFNFHDRMNNDKHRDDLAIKKVIDENSKSFHVKKEYVIVD